MDHDRDILGKAVARLKREALSQEAPKAVVDETLRRLADAPPEAGGDHPEDGGYREPRRITLRGTTLRLSLAAAALVAIGCVIGRLSGPAPVNLGKLHEALAPSLAASIEPAIRARVVEDLQRRYQLALAATYVKVKEELTAQYRDDLNRFAVLTLAASNETTNRRLAELVESIDSAQAQDLHRVARVLSQIERDRMQDKTQFAAGLEKLATRTEETRQFVHLLVDVLPEDSDEQRDLPIENPNERTDP